MKFLHDFKCFFYRNWDLLFFLNIPGIVHFKEIHVDFSVFPHFIQILKSRFPELRQWKTKGTKILPSVLGLRYILQLVKFLNKVFSDYENICLSDHI